jgi:phosphatidylcholine synthase
MTEPRSESGPRHLSAAPAWLVHAFTGTSALLAFLSLEAVARAEWRTALVWLLVALFVDSVDGTLARAARVKQRTPGFDGAALDLIVDFLTYVFVPTIFIVRAGLVPDGLALPLAALILFSSLYHFARADMKSADNYFRGFPALWNVVAFYLYVTRPGPEAGAVVVALLAASSFAPVYFVHPFRVRDYGVAPPVLAVAWAAATAPLLWVQGDGARTILLWLSLASGAILIAMGLLRSVRGERRHERPLGRQPEA